ncbi:Por secretion system C-terminal sorting domain-containing protein [Cyclonatronum proteinivorum]|uniref:Por secretion system C-terminal sorting domain-containing protein n=1 Tax=Cyclonatronum proteinivorum TaxID=1457365 RepID=A0A345UNQ8_9BACT|nr:alpha-amylase domain-containing protein [Cyclonatronum proteinivorum]AXJ02110.1 Por secretion system C-terminal sorting domain-containing protein [Cyclonatronum proteinivorum]
MKKYLLLFVFTLIVSGAAQAQQDRTMMQGFYWDVTPGGVWYDSLAVNADLLGLAGFNSIWLPPPSKGAAGGFDVGYTPYDYYDLGNFDSRAGDQTSGTGAFIPTRYGTLENLQFAIERLKANGLKVYADIVLNHRSGGNLEPNIYGEFYTDRNGGSLFSPDGDSTFTAFPLTHGSGRIGWPVGEGNEFFFPNAVHNQSNTADFLSGSQLAGFHQMYVNEFGYTNALHTGSGQSLPVGDSLKVWGDWLTNTLGLDGYRFDFVKGVHPEYFKSFMNFGAMQGKFHVHELFDGDIGRKLAYLEMLNTTNSPFSPSPPPSKPGAIFDFNMRFAYKAMSDGGDNYDIRNWHNAGLHNVFGVPFEQIVFFVDNHDFDRTDYTGSVTAPGHSPVVNNKMLAYAHMLTHPGYAQVWYRDYFNYGLRDEINLLLQVRNQLGGGSYRALTRPGDGGGNPFFPGNPDEDPRHVYIAERSGTGGDTGLIVAINKHSSFEIDVWVDTQWPERTLYDLTGNFDGTIEVFEDGRARIKTKPSSYHIFVPVEYSLELPPANIALNEIVSPTGTRFIEETITPRVSFTNESLFSQQNIGLTFTVLSGNEVVYADAITIPQIGSGVTNEAVFEGFELLLPGTYTAVAEIDFEDDSDPSDNLLEIVFEVVDPNEATAFRIDGVINEPQYILMAEKENDNAGFGPGKDVRALWYFADSDSLYIAIESEMVLGDADGIGIFLDFEEVQGLPAGTPLGGAEGAVSFLNPPNPVNQAFKMDFEVDFGFAWIGAQNRVLMSVADYTGDEKLGKLVLPASASPGGNGATGTGPAEDGLFPANSIRYAMLNDGEANHGVEFAVALADLGVSGGRFRAFAFIVSGTGYFSNVLLPGDANGTADAFQNFGYNADFGTVEGGPFHTPWFSISDPTNIEPETRSELPTQAELSQNYPNPFNPTTNIRYAVPETGQVTLEVFNLLGQRVALLVDEVMQPGTYTLNFDATRLASGVYLYRLQTGGQVLTRKMTLIK